MRSITTLLFALLLAACAASGEESTDAVDRFPTSSSYPAGTMERVSFAAGVPEAWRISALSTPTRPDAPWKIVIITGTPSWSEYWAPTIAALPDSREMIVADRPGFQQSEPEAAVRDISKQADALAPMLEAHPGQRVLLVGQSFGAPVATLMADRYPDRVDAVVLVSPFFGDRGPTARRLFGVGRVARPLLRRDLRNSIDEIAAQRAQLPTAFVALRRLEQPVLIVHGGDDSFVPFEAAQRMSVEYARPFAEIRAGDHFLNACCVPDLLAAFERAIAEAGAQPVAAT